jgi:hypothetical protein
MYTRCARICNRQVMLLITRLRNSHALDVLEPLQNPDYNEARLVDSELLT